MEQTRAQCLGVAVQCTSPNLSGAGLVADRRLHYSGGKVGAEASGGSRRRWFSSNSGVGVFSVKKGSSQAEINLSGAGVNHCIKRRRDNKQVIKSALSECIWSRSAASCERNRCDRDLVLLPSWTKGEERDDLELGEASDGKSGSAVTGVAGCRRKFGSGCRRKKRFSLFHGEDKAAGKQRHGRIWPRGVIRCGGD
ncbi:hypothetical protein U1Q18_038399 [Sarracenia purpurea var. burkii]